MSLEEQLTSLLARQLSSWGLCGKNFGDLGSVMHRDVLVANRVVRIQCNPARIRSSAANVSAAAVKERPCFLCENNRPKEQETVIWRSYHCLVNPYPIFSRHFTIAAAQHKPQRFDDVVADMMDLAELMPQHFVFYNGPRCGASAPDHLHLQVGVPEEIPLKWNEPHGCYHIIADTPQLAALRTKLLMHNLKTITHTTEEPMVNVIARYFNKQIHVYVFHRRLFRPWQYSAEEPERILVSPATAEVAGLIITPSVEHYNKITATDIASIYEQCLYPADYQQPLVSVGICSATNCKLTHDAQGLNVLDRVTIGRDFHWQQNLGLRFQGSMRTTDVKGVPWYVNDIDVEQYLISVICSEMAPAAPAELLKAHAIISRTWLMHAILQQEDTNGEKCHHQVTDGETYHHQVIYERDAHTAFDVCADDHCQRYQGVHDNINEAVANAVKSTEGIVLEYHGQICDARFSKCCGGTTELFSTCWADIDYPYLTSHPDPYCDPEKHPLNKYALNTYDYATKDYYRWQITVSGEDIRRFILEKTGMDLGDITDLEALERGPSQRIKKLRITGKLRSIIVSKELEIRRLLSPTHLYSSAFDISKTDDKKHVFQLRGRGWGHGVGLCQIGAANMAEEGYTHKQILDFYYPDTQLTKIY